MKRKYTMKSKYIVRGAAALLCAAALVAPASVRAFFVQESPADKVEDGAKKIGEGSKEGAQKVASKTKEGLSKTGEVITDGWITTRVHGRFVTDDLLKGSDIDVDTNDHVVTLKGTVTSAAGRAKAARIARRTEGVHRVVNRLTIGPKQ